MLWFLSVGFKKRRTLVNRLVNALQGDRIGASIRVWLFVREFLNL